MPVRIQDISVDISPAPPPPSSPSQAEHPGQAGEMVDRIRLELGRDDRHRRRLRAD
jgi:hypothetical protein